MRQINLGIIGTGWCGGIRAVTASRSPLVNELHLAEINPERLEQISAQTNPTRATDDWAELVNNPDIDAIIVSATPEHLHHPMTKAALEAGKHVLCEKPIGLSSSEAQQLVAAARLYPKLKVMEAFMYRHHPQWRKSLQLIAEGGIGELRTVDSVFSYWNVDPDNIRNQGDIGGGGMMDIGCYCVSLSRLVFQSEPIRVMGAVQSDPVFQTDRMASGVLEFAGGTATFTCSTQLSPYQRVNIFGTEGRIEIEIPFNAPPDRACRLWHQRGATTTEHVVDVCDQYIIQGDLFARAILDDTPVPTPLDDAVHNMRVIEAVLASARDNAWVPMVA